MSENLLKSKFLSSLEEGETFCCPVKYEKLPLICFYCGKLGHGTNDCKDTFGDQSPVKLFGPWLKASPWKPVSVEGEEEAVGSKNTCGKRLFITKKKDCREISGDNHNKNLIDVASLLNKVVLGDNEDQPHGEKGLACSY